MRVVIANPPWKTGKKLGFRANVRWPFMISQREFELQKKALYHFPLYHAYTAALLRAHGHEVRVMDAAVRQQDTTSFVSNLAELKPDLVIMEISTPSFALDVITIEELRARLKVHLALIGSHATVFDRQILEQYHQVDTIIRGEFEETALDLANQLQSGSDPGAVAGITYRTANGEIRATRPRPYLTELDTLPYPARELYDWQRYHEPVYEALPWITLVSSRGCPFRCIFCAWPQIMYGQGYRMRKADAVVDEIEYCLHQFQPGEFFFDDDTFTVQKKHVRCICRLILERKLEIRWSCMGRIDTVDVETLELMAGAGCTRIKFGIETGSETVMKNIRKKINLADVHQTVQCAQAAGIKVHGTFMIGLPGETRQTAQQTIDLALSLGLDTAQFSIATPFPGTEFYRLAETNGWLLTHDWSKYDGATGAVISYPHFSKKEIDTYLAIAWTRLFSEQRDLIKLVRKTLNKFRVDGLRETLRIIRTYFSFRRRS
ncbi:radical SAM protein [bacterium]|nr:radical SAM protein [bacterium]